jgi:glycosyltransferase involved in cell wall biosynthesis
VELQHSFFSPIRSGVERKIHAVAEELLRRGIGVAVCSSAEGVEDVSRYEEKGIRFALHPPYFSKKPQSILDPVTYPRRVGTYLKERCSPERPDLVLSFNLFYALAAKEAWPQVPVGYLAGSTVWDWYAWLHGDRDLAARCGLFPKRLLAVRAERRAINVADMVFVESNLLRERLQFFHGIQDKIGLLPAPVDTLRFHPSVSWRQAVREELGIPHNIPVVLGVGRLQWNKNFATLIRALSLLNAQEWLLIIVGEGGEKERLQRLAKDTCVADRVRFVAFRSNMETVYAASDIFAHSAVVEPYGFVILEALAAGLPCVVSPPKYVGVSHELEDGRNVIFADPDDPRDWAIKIARLLTSPGLRASLGEQGRLLCEKRGSWRTFTDHLLQHFAVATPADSEPKT